MILTHAHASVLAAVRAGEGENLCSKDSRAHTPHTSRRVVRDQSV